MSIYKLGYTEANGTVIPLPGSFNKHTELADLQKFASEHGYDPSKWDAGHDAALKSFFENVAFTSVEVEDPLNELDWRPFKQAIDEEAGLFPLPWDVFEQRIKDGVLNGILDANGKLVATINVLPKLSAGLKRKLDIEDHPEAPQVYETGAGFANLSHRGLGIYTAFRRVVLKESAAKDRLIFSQSRGKGASHVNVREGWALINSSDYPFATALLGWPESKGLMGQKIQLASGLLLDLPEKGLYVGDSIDFSKKELIAGFQETHDWTDYHHFWVNDLEKLRAFEHKIRADLGLKRLSEEVVVQHTYENWLESIQKHSFVVQPVDRRDSAINDNGVLTPEAIG